MLRFLTQELRNRHGVRRYTLEEFGLDRESERQSFKFLTNFFGIEREL